MAPSTFSRIVGSSSGRSAGCSTVGASEPAGVILTVISRVVWPLLLPRLLGSAEALTGRIRIAQRAAEIEVDRRPALPPPVTSMRALTSNGSKSTRPEPPASRLRSTPTAPPPTAAVGEHRILGRDLLAHDDDLFPLAGGRLAARIGQLARDREELLVVAPHEEHFEELELEIATIGLALDRDAHEVGGLVVQTVGHVEIGFGQRIALVEIDRGLAADGFVGAHRRRERDVLRFLQGAMRAGFLDEDVVRNRAHAAGARMRPVSDSESIGCARRSSP